MTHRTSVLLCSLALALSLAACSDSPEADLPPPAADNTVPLSAQASTAAWTSYTAAQPSSDSAEPLDVNSATPPASDTEEPRPV